MTAQSDDELLNALGEVARAEDAAADPRWEALASGTLSPTDRAALEALAARDPEAAALWDLLAPSKTDLDDAITATLLADRPASGASATGSDAPVIPLRARRARRVWVTIGTLAIAAGLLFALLPGRAPLPAYAIESHAGERVMRGDDAPTVDVYGAGSQLDLILRPAADVPAAIAVRVFHVRDGAARVLPVSPTISPTGVVRLRGPVDQLLPAGVGVHRLVFAVGAPDALPKSVDASHLDRLNGGDGWQALHYEYQRR